MLGLIVLFVLAFILMAFFEGVELAFLSCNKLKVKHLADAGNRSAVIVSHFQRNPNAILTTILIGTNLAHVGLTSLFAYVMKVYVGVTDSLIDTLILAPFIIIFAETVPKDWFRRRADDFIYALAPVLLFFDRLLRPFTVVILSLSDFLLGLMQPMGKRSPFVTKEEFRYVVDESAKGGVLLEHEKELIHTILNLGSTTVSQVMTSLRQFPNLELSNKVSDARELARKSKKPLILIYEEIPSIVVGVIYVFDILFEENPDASLAKYLHPPLFVHQDASVERVLSLLQSKQSSYAVVTNQQSEVIGVAAIENLIRF